MINAFNIVNGEAYTLDDVRTHQKAGGSVLRSAHIGNFNTTTLFLASEGFPVLLHEHLRGVSKIYEPAYMKLKGKRFPLTENTDLPVTHLTTADNRMTGVKKARHIIADFKNPAEFHYYSLRKLFPYKIQLVSELFLEQEAFFRKALGILAREFPSFFTQYVREDGTIFNLLGERFASDETQIYASRSGERITLKKKDIAELTFKYAQDTVCVAHGEESKAQGIVMSVPLYVLLTTLCEVYKNRNGEQRYRKNMVTAMHFSGAGMMDYLILKKEEAADNSRKIEEMHQALLKEMPGVLPQRINFVLIPTWVLKDFILKSKRHIKNLERLSVNYDQFIEKVAHLNKKKAKEFFEKEKKSLCKDARYMGTQPDISQYDLLCQNYRLYAPNFLFHKSHAYLRVMRNTLLRGCSSSLGSSK